MRDFQMRLEREIEQVRRESRWAPEDASRYMTALAERKTLFESTALTLMDQIIRPRIEILASQFANACLAKDTPFGRISYWFGYCERFPASTSLAFAVEHDVSIETIFVCCEVSMMPMFIKINERDRLTMLLDEVDSNLVLKWTEDRLIEFLDDYLQIDRGSKEFQGDVATDPVCGMRIGRSNTTFTGSYRGHPYFFCSRDCQQQFAAKPTDFVNVRAM
ncbi:MAG: YHS domain-containing protein [Pirellulaceae bacterium]|nr:YHS domain-containing protein [Pirellulaceae bacterium]